MSDDDILRDLERIREESEKTANLDEHVSFVADDGKRKRFLERFESVKTRISNRRLQKGPELFGRFYLKSTLLLPKDGRTQLDFTFEYFGEAIEHILTMNGVAGLDSLDSPMVRILLYDEYLNRCKLVEEMVLSGKLDGYIKYSPEAIIFSIMGFSDSFMSTILGIDPTQGETYKLFTDFIEKRRKIDEETQKTKLREKNNDESLLKEFDSLARNFNILISNQPRTGKIINISDSKPDTEFKCVPLTSNILKHMHLPDDTTGILVTQIEPGSPMEKAGLRRGYRIIEVNGEEIPLDGDIIIKVDGLEMKKSEDLILYL